MVKTTTRIQGVSTMAEMLLRVMVVALGFLMFPRDDPQVANWDDTVTTKYTRHEERLLREEEELLFAKPPVSDQQLPDVLDNILNKEKEEFDLDHTEKDKMYRKISEKDTEEVVSHRPLEEHLIEGPGSNLSEKFEESEGEMLTSQIIRQQSEKDTSTNFSAEELRDECKKMKASRTELQDLSLLRLQTKTSENETSEKPDLEWEMDFFWFLWNTFSVLSIICYFGKYLSGNSQIKERATRRHHIICSASEVSLPEVNTLVQFHTKCVQVLQKKWRDEEFLEGFANDLVDAMKSVCDKSSVMMIDDLQLVSQCDIFVSLAPPRPYRFECQLCDNKASDILLDPQMYGLIKLVEDEKIQNGCPCLSADPDDEMVCLLHCENEMEKTGTVLACDGPLCSKNSSFLSGSQVTKWFQCTIRQAWKQISHKYEFELNLHYIDGPGALALRFRSGKKINFRMIPVVRFPTDAHLFSTPRSSTELDTFWTLSLSSYEKQIFEYLCGHLPKNACHNRTLEIALFLHKRQMALSGSSALKAFHFKTALMHLLVQTKPVQWEENCLVFRLRELLEFMEKSLDTRTLNHILIGYPLGEIIGVPKEILKAKPINLFNPFVAHDCIYKNAIMHFQEMLRNANVLIHDYIV